MNCLDPFFSLTVLYNFYNSEIQFKIKFNIFFTEFSRLILKVIHNHKTALTLEEEKKRFLTCYFKKKISNSFWLSRERKLIFITGTSSSLI